MAKDGVDRVGVRREGMLYLTNTLSGVGVLYQTAFYGLPSDVPVVDVWRELSADQLPPLAIRFLYAHLTRPTAPR